MEAERKRLPRRERRGSKTSQPQEPVNTVALDQDPAASNVRSGSTSDPFQPAPPSEFFYGNIQTPPIMADVGEGPPQIGAEKSETTTEARHEHYRDKPIGGATAQISDVGIMQIENSPIDSLSRRTKFKRQGHSGNLSFTEGGRSNKDRHIEEIEHEKHDMRLPAPPFMPPRRNSTLKPIGQPGQPQSAAETRTQLKQTVSRPITAEAEKATPLPLFDAPKSAVNAGERTVRVKYKEFQVPVAISPSTTPAEVIHSVADKIATPIHQDSLVLLEAFKQLGLERPLRRYEHIRDVLNSWDDDAQNSLIIEPSSTDGNDDDLDLTSVSRRPPDDGSFCLYHSQRPSHWDKRVVTLRSDGQMSVAKSNGSEISNICHLSDFDIYIPTARQLAKKIKPPKRICFAVKSQQKSNMFMSTINFVHFFSSNDKKLAKSLYLAIQGWRSWYLVNMMGKGQEDASQVVEGPLGKPRRNFGAETRAKDAAQWPKEPIGDQETPAHSSGRALDAKHPRSGQKDLSTTLHTLQPSERDASKRVQQAPPMQSFQKSSLPVPADAPFTGGGLLGRAYTQRKKAQQDHEVMQTALPVQFPLSSSSTSPVKGSSKGLRPTSSERQKPKPLVDLTPQYQEPPQHLRKGKGVTPGQLPIGGLVDIATSPEIAIPIPPTMDWRRLGTSP
ncbi:MAG: hypothetical protein Q9222_000333 [Ikaeria aurantiellina]